MSKIHALCAIDSVLAAKPTFFFLSPQKPFWVANKRHQRLQHTQKHRRNMSASSKRASADEDDSSRKKTRMAGEEGARAERYNPYLAHMNGYGNNESSSPFAGLERRATTAAQASKIEDLPENPWTGKPHSQQYFRILETRRDLPVHKQRYVDDDDDAWRSLRACMERVKRKSHGRG